MPIAPFAAAVPLGFDPEAVPVEDARLDAVPLVVAAAVPLAAALLVAGSTAAAATSSELLIGAHCKAVEAATLFWSTPM
jgi:hypothetical protein